MWQVLVGILYVVIGGLNINKENNQQAASILNDVILLLVFITSILNIVISGFGIEHSNEVPSGNAGVTTLGPEKLLAAPRLKFPEDN